MALPRHAAESSAVTLADYAATSQSEQIVRVPRSDDDLLKLIYPILSLSPTDGSPLPIGCHCCGIDDKRQLRQTSQAQQQ